MIDKIVKISLVMFFLSSVIFPQQKTTKKFGSVYKYELNNSAFPHQLRSEGHFYKGNQYSAEEHYTDQSTIIFIPDYYSKADSVNIVFYFHGWGNNIDTSVSRFNLIEQFYKSNKDGILVLTETAKNAPDSFGGNLEEKNVFSELTTEILDKVQGIYGFEIDLGDISLAGHSGAYRVMAYILMHGGVTKNIDAVYIFDGLYSDAEKYSFWLDNFDGKFINIYTPNGGTVSESENLMHCLRSWEIPYAIIEDDDFDTAVLQKERIIFIKSKLEHSEVIHTKNQFQKFLESSL